MSIISVPEVNVEWGLMAIKDVRIVLVGTLYGGNVGSICRAMANTGVSDLVLVAPSPDLDLAEARKMAVAADGTVYVADTWNTRIQAFKAESTGEYAFVSQWPVDAWYGQSLENKPYLAIDAQGRLYATDPESYRVLVFAKDGKFLTTWGENGTGDTQFGIVSGVGVNSQGQIYVVDSGNSRLMRFPALP